VSDGPDRPWDGPGQPGSGDPAGGAGAGGPGGPPPGGAGGQPPGATGGAPAGGPPPGGYGSSAPQPYGAPPAQPVRGGVPSGTAGLGARIGARLLDVLIVGIPAAIVLGLVGLGAGAGGMFGLRNWLWNAIVSILWFGYFVLMESNQGATIGKRLLNLRVVTADGSNPAMDVAAKRNIWMLFGLIPFLGGLIGFVAVIVIMVTIASDTDNRGYHDQFAGTAVMR
jgi:uncharacterized RDD family membrane protein YckC